MDAVILAAGFSSRAGDYKMTMKIEGRYILYRTLDAFVHQCDKIIVVTGYQSEIIHQIISEYEYASQITCVYNEDYEQGMFTSIQKGVKAVDSLYFYLTPGDYPLIKKATVESLKLALANKAEVLIPSYNHKSGHPILLCETIKNAILEASKESNLRLVLSTVNKQYVDVDDDGILLDVDTPEDFQNIKMKFHKKPNK